MTYISYLSKVKGQTLGLGWTKTKGDLTNCSNSSGHWYYQKMNALYQTILHSMNLPIPLQNFSKVKNGKIRVNFYQKTHLKINIRRMPQTYKIHSSYLRSAM